MCSTLYVIYLQSQNAVHYKKYQIKKFLLGNFMGNYLAL